MAIGSGDGRVAIYWDFENLVRRVSEDGSKADVAAIAGYGATFGTVVVNRAYADWARFTSYRNALHRSAVDLVQLFDVASTKNGADIRLAADAVADRFLNPDLTHVMIVSSDSDFTGLARRLRELGVVVIGIGVKTATDAWRYSCSDFKLYSDLVSAGRSTPSKRPISEADRQGARTLLAQAAHQLFTSVGEEDIAQGRLSSMMKRLDPSFDLARAGFRNFTAMVDDIGSDIVKRHPVVGGDDLLSYVADSKTAMASTPPTDAAARAYRDSESLAALRRILVERSNVVPDPDKLRWVIANADVFPPRADDAASLDEEIVRAAAGSFNLSAVDARRIRSLLAGAAVIESAGGTSLMWAVTDPSEARRRVSHSVAGLIIRSRGGQVDLTDLTDLLFGPDAHPEEQADVQHASDAVRGFGSDFHRASDALRRSGITVIGAECIARTAASLASGDLAGEWDRASEADLTLMEVLGIGGVDASRVRSLVARALRLDDVAGSKLVLTPDLGGPELYRRIGSLIGTGYADDVNLAFAGAVVELLDVAVDGAEGIALLNGIRECSDDAPSETGGPEAGGTWYEPDTSFEWGSRTMVGEAAAVAQKLNACKVRIDDPVLLQSVVDRTSGLSASERTWDGLIEVIDEVAVGLGLDPSSTSKNRLRGLFLKAGAFEEVDGVRILMLAGEDLRLAVLESVWGRSLSWCPATPSAESIAEIVFGGSQSADVERARLALARATNGDAGPGDG